MTVSVHAAKTQLSKLLDLIEEGEKLSLPGMGVPWRVWFG
jgi:antitoxin (DNA-binding transcriptional repressor) of toxin-antitoxin stability system